jgi:hypothetical protein
MTSFEQKMVDTYLEFTFGIMEEKDGKIIIDCPDENMEYNNKDEMLKDIAYWYRCVLEME